MKNAWLKFPPASLAKLATSIMLARASADRWDEHVEILDEDLCSGSRMGLIPGDVVTRRDILHGMLLPTGNDAATVASRLIGPSWRDGMNSLAAELGMAATRFVNPHGRDVAGQPSTDRDLARLAAAAFAISPIRQAAGARRYEFRIGGPHARTVTIGLTVRMLEEPNIVAGKTGSTQVARGCLALLVDKAGREVVLVVTGASVAFDATGVIEQSDRRYDDARRHLGALSCHLQVVQNNADRPRRAKRQNSGRPALPTNIC